MSCIGDCIEIGPPPDNILFLPPPPAPNFVTNALPSEFLSVNTTSCTLAQLCEPFLVTITAAPKLGHASGDYFELPGKGTIFSFLFLPQYSFQNSTKTVLPKQ